MTVYYVNKDIFGGTGDGSSEANASATVTSAWMAHGNAIYIKDATTRLTIPSIAIPTAPTDGQKPFKMEGYTDVPGDLGLAKITVSPHISLTSSTESHIFFSSLDIACNIGYSGAIFSTYGGCYFFNCKIVNESTEASNTSSFSLSSSGTSGAMGCYIENRAFNAPAADVRGFVAGCHFHSKNYGRAFLADTAYRTHINMFNIATTDAVNKQIGFDFLSGGTTYSTVIAYNTAIDFGTAFRINDLPTYNYSSQITMHGNLASKPNVAILNKDFDGYEAGLDTYRIAAFEAGPTQPIVNLAGTTSFKVQSVTDTKKFIFSVAIDTTKENHRGSILAGGWGRFHFLLGGWDRITLSFRGKTAGELMSYSTSDSEFDQNFGMQVFTAAGDMNTGDVVLYRGSELIHHETGIVDDLIDFSGEITVGFTQNNGNEFEGDMAFAYFDNDHSLNLTGGTLPQSVLDYFIDAQEKPTDLSTAPSAHVKLSGNAAAWATNNGTGPDPIIGGSITDVTKDSGSFIIRKDIGPVESTHIDIDPFTDAANGDYSLNNTAGGGLELKNTLPFGLVYGAVQSPRVGSVNGLLSSTAILLMI
jgi:hypothetical protein